MSAISDATARRAAILRKLSVELARVHDPTLSEPQLRDINDNINLLLNKRRGVERAIKKLGGPDYTTSAALNAKDAVTVKGYKYFGRAKQLPDVIALLEEAEREQKRIKSAKNIDQRLKSFKSKKNWVNYRIQIDGDDHLKRQDDIQGNGRASLTSLNFAKFANVAPLLADAQKMNEFLVKRKKTLLLQRLKANRTSKKSG